MKRVVYILLITGAGWGASFLAPPAEATPGFKEVTGQAGFKHSGESYGVSWGDFNGDGLPDLFVNNHRDKVAFYRNNGDGSFTNVTSKVDGSGVWVTAPKQDTHGGSWGDFDNDGDQDLYITTGGAVDGRMLVNEGGILYDRAREVGLVNDVEGRLPVWVDYDRDGDLDLAMMIRSASRMFKQRNTNLIDFDNVTNQTGLTCSQMDYGQLLDVNGDGVMELFCGNGTFPQKVYDTTTLPFTDITSRVESIPRGTDSAMADFDGDLDQDIFVVVGAKIPSDAGLVNPFRLEASLGSPPNKEKGIQFSSSGVLTVELYLKRQLRDLRRIHIGARDAHPSDFTFNLNPNEPRVQGIMTFNPAVANGVFIGYLPGQQRWQIILTGLSGRAAGAYVVVRSTERISNLQMLNLIRGDLPDRPSLLLNTGSRLVEDGRSHGLTKSVSCVSVVAADFDNDRDVDVYAVCRGGVENLPNLLFENLGNGDFKQVQSRHGAEGVLGFHLADKAGLGDSVVTADYNADGCIDLFVTNGLPLEPGRHKSGPDQLFRNLCNYGNHWFELDLEGLGRGGGSNRDGIGARVYLTAGGVTQMRDQNGGYHRWSQNDKRLHFGLGPSAKISQLSVEWPSGMIDVFEGPIAADGVYLAREGAAALELVPLNGGGSPPPPPPGPVTTCGKPNINRAVERGVYLWQECPGNRWHMRVTAGGGPRITYEGEVSAVQPFPSPPIPFRLEGPDWIDSSDARAIRYGLRVVKAGQDGIDFEIPAGGQTCFDVFSPSSAQVFIGKNKQPVGTSVDLATTGSCN